MDPLMCPRKPWGAGVRRYYFEGATPEGLAKALLNQVNREHQENQEIESTTEENKEEPEETSS